MDPRTSLGIAILAIFIPTMLAAMYLLFRRHGRPRMVWYFMFMFTLFRIASGALIITYPDNQSNVGIIIATIITLGVGVIPLLMATIGFLRIIHLFDFQEHPKLRKAIYVSRFGFYAGIILLTVGGGLMGNYLDPNSVRIGHILSQTAYVVILLVLLTMLGFELWLWRFSATMSRTSFLCLTAITAAMPFQLVRIAFALLGAFNPNDHRWSALSGNINAFIGMSLVMELIVVIMYLAVGYTIEPIGKEKAEEVALESGR